MPNFVLYCIVFIGYSLHRHYIKFSFKEFVMILVTMHEMIEMTEMHNSYSAQVTMPTETK